MIYGLWRFKLDGNIGERTFWDSISYFVPNVLFVVNNKVSGVIDVKLLFIYIYYRRWNVLFLLVAPSMGRPDRRDNPPDT